MSPAYFFSLKYSKSRKTGSGHAADSKLCYTIQFSILVLCAKYQEDGHSGSREKCDRNYLVSKFAYVHNIQSSGHAANSKLRYTIQVSILMLCAKYQEAGLCGSWEKCDRCPQYLKSRKTGSGQATDSKLRYTIQFSILMLCAKYQEAGLCGSPRKCDRNFLWRRRRRRKTTEVIPICRLR